MRFPRSLLLISVLMAGLYSQAPQSAPAQQSNTVTVRSRMSAPRAGIPDVSAIADRTRVPVGDQVTFNLSPASVVKDPRYQVTLFFGDGERQVVQRPQVAHIYRASGNYTYSILVEPSKRITTPATPVVIPEVQLIVTPRSVQANRPVSFNAELSRPTQGISYRFNFGDSSKADWSAESQMNHVYTTPGTYQPYVDIGLRERGTIKQVGGSKRETITITNGAANADGNNNANNANTVGKRNNNRSNNGNGNFNTRPSGNLNGSTNGNSSTNGNQSGSANLGSNRRGANVNANATPQASATSSASLSAGTNNSRDDWWPYLVFLPLLMLAGYKAVTYFLLPRPTFVPHSDVGRAKSSGLALDYQVDLDPNVDGAFRIDTEGGSLIKGTRKSDD